MLCPPQITFVDFLAYDVLDQQRMFAPDCPELQGNLGQFLQRFEVSGDMLGTPCCHPPRPRHPSVPVLAIPVSPSLNPQCLHPQDPCVPIPIPSTPMSLSPSLTPRCPCSPHRRWRRSPPTCARGASSEPPFTGPRHIGATPRSKWGCPPVSPPASRLQNKPGGCPLSGCCVE